MFREIAKAIVRRAPLIALDYPINPIPRWGFGRPPHRQLESIISSRAEIYSQQLRLISGLRDDFLGIPEISPDPTEPSRRNGFFSGLDALALYGFLRNHNPSLYVEIGSGHSTRFAARAVRDGRLRTRIVSIDPHPRAEMDSLAERVVRAPLENVDQSIFEDLRPGDFLFFDGSHYALPNSDVVTFFLEVLPALPSGVIVQVHDIRLPYDYPPKLHRHWYGEQYILAMYLLCTKDPKVLLPNYWIWEQPELRVMVSDICHGGNSFWFET